MDSYMLNYINEIKKEFSIGSYVLATIYNLRHKGIYEPQKVKIVRFVSDEQMKQGYRFGIIVEYNEHEYWVRPADVKNIGEDNNYYG